MKYIGTVTTWRDATHVKRSWSISNLSFLIECCNYNHSISPTETAKPQLCKYLCTTFFWVVMRCNKLEGQKVQKYCHQLFVIGYSSNFSYGLSFFLQVYFLFIHCTFIELKAFDIWPFVQEQPALTLIRWAEDVHVLVLFEG